MKRAVLLAGVAALVIGVRLYGGPPAPRSLRPAALQAPASAEERGRLVYAQYGCGMCHGREGKGGVSNPNAETGGVMPGLEYVAEGYTAGELRRLIVRGVTRVGRADPDGPEPPYRMPGSGDRMSDPELADLVAFLMSLYTESEDDAWW